MIATRAAPRAWANMRWAMPLTPGWVEELFKRGFSKVQPDLRENLLAYYDGAPPPKRTRKAQKAWRRTACELEVLRAGPGLPAGEALRERLLHPPRGLESPKAKG